MAGGQRLGCMREHRGLVAGVEHVPGITVHHHRVVVDRKNDPARVPAGPQILLQQLSLPRAAVVEQCLRDLADGAVGECDQQRTGVFAPAGQAHRADDLAGDRVAYRLCGAGEILQMLGVMLVTEHVRRPAAFQRRADAVSPGELLGIAETR